MLVRKAAVAGEFYPKEKASLLKTLQHLLRKPKKIRQKNKPKILVCPHAGIYYCGKTAACGYGQIQGKDYNLVVLLGTSHYSFFPYASIFSSGRWQTPLGEVSVDKSLTNSITDGVFIKNDPLPHLPEHSLEIQLIFLQTVLSQFKIVPILVSEVNSNLLNLLSEKLANLIKKDKALLIVSSDLSHFPQYNLANKVDKRTIKAICSGQLGNFEKTLKNLKENYPEVETFACGENAIKISLRVAELLNIKKFTLFKYQNSGDITEDKSGVVGYASIGGYF